MTEFKVPSLAGLMPSVPDVSRWELRSDRRRVDIGLGSIHHGATVDVGEPLLLRVPCPGRHTLAWTLRTKSGRRPCTGVLELVVPEAAADRRPFTRLAGPIRYPDVPWVDEDGEVVREARTSDPPSEPPPPPTASDLTGRLREMGARSGWVALYGSEDPSDAAGVAVDRAEEDGSQARSSAGESV